MINLILERLKELVNVNDITIIGIDGPTAAGKTILAEKLGNSIRDSFDINVEFFRLDWLLEERVKRQNDLVELKKDSSPFFLEGELHMNLEKFKDFLKKAHQLKKIELSQGLDRKLMLDNLYSRENDGQCNGIYEFDFSKKTVVICEGHYTSRSEYTNFIDLNICLLCKKEELLKRKVERVKSYRSPQDAIDYFWKIDIPSFSYHLRRFLMSIDIFVDNTDFLHPSIRTLDYANSWIGKETSELVKPKKCDFSKKETFETIYNDIFSKSKILKLISESELTELIMFHKILDQIISKKLQDNFTTADIDLTCFIEEKVKLLNAQINTKQEENKIIISSNSSLYDVYDRKIPVSLGIKFQKKNFKEIRLNYSINMYSHEIIIFWEGGMYEISINRSLTNIKANVEYELPTIKNILIFENEIVPNNDYLKEITYLYTPTNYCKPGFLNDQNFNYIFTGREHETTSLYQIIRKLIIHESSVLAHRISSYKEIEFYLELLMTIGMPSINISNYIISIKTKQYSLRNQFRSWIREWTSSDPINKDDQKQYDESISKELNDSKNLLLKFSKNFSIADSYLFRKNSNPDINLVIKELSEMLTSKNRTLRKRAFQFILKDEPSLRISGDDILECFGINKLNQKKDDIALSDLPFYFPTIFAEVYLWTHIRQDHSGILGANVYDIDLNNSLDIQGLLKTSSLNSTPIVLQASFNAIGQEEKNDDLSICGYLKLEDGPQQLVDASITSCFINTIIDGNDIPFYGIGLDHVDAKNDLPQGRAIRFLNKAVNTGNITHVVLDGSALFSAKNRDVNNLRSAYEKVADYAVYLLGTKNDLFLTDLEFCVGEMNYIGDSKEGMIPFPKEINLFSEILRGILRRKTMGLYNCRPNLFIGNVGTTHHTKDSHEVDTTITYEWVESVKNKNLISAVLHGTTNSSPSILKQSTKGCHKVNVAGDFLKVYLKSLPQYVPKEIRKFNPESKYNMTKIRDLKNTFTKEDSQKIIKEIYNSSSKITSTINSPVFSKRDKSYFHRCNYNFPIKLINKILDRYKETKKEINFNFSEKKNNLTNYFSASMIEVPFDETFCEICQNLIDFGIKHFHIDVGDGKFISRKFGGLQKVKYLSKLNPALKLHAHLMVEDPLSLLEDGKNYIDSYIDSGITSLAPHMRSFKTYESLKEAINYIRQKGCNPGIIIELTETDLTDLWDKIKDLNLNWVVIMGVPIGFGGQLFQSRCLRTINFIRKKCLEENINNFDIEIDGGLNFNNIKDCVDAGANICAGWSIIKSNTTEEIIKKYEDLKNLINK